MGPIGIMGGTFDPIHNGHIFPAIEIAGHLEFSKVLLLPLGVAVHREQPLASSEQRLEMCRLVAEGNEILEVDDREIRRGGASYSVLTLEELRREYGPELPLCWIMGRDAIEGFTSWKDWPRILELAHIIVTQRPGYEWEKPLPGALHSFLADNLQGASGSIVLQTVEQQDISSTDIRKKLASGEFVQDEVDENVRKYIFKHKLYS